MKKYVEFVDTVTADYSKDNEVYLKRLKELADSGIQIARLDTALTGLASESGEALDVLKKLKFQGAEWDQSKEKITKELGDVVFYLTNALIALDLDLDEIMAQNKAKLRGRYSSGKFTVEESNNRK